MGRLAGPYSRKYDALENFTRFFSRPTRGALHSATPRYSPRILFTDTAPGGRLRLPNTMPIARNFSVNQPARASSRGEPGDTSWSTRALGDLAWLASWPTQGTLHPGALTEALFHRHRARSAAAVSRRAGRSFRIPWRAARASFAP